MPPRARSKTPGRERPASPSKSPARSASPSKTPRARKPSAVAAAAVAPKPRAARKAAAAGKADTLETVHYVITGLLALVAVLAFATPQYLIGAIFTPKVAATVTPVGYFFAKVAAGFMIPAAVAANSLVHTPNKQLTLALALTGVTLVIYSMITAGLSANGMYLGTAFGTGLAAFYGYLYAAKK